MDASREILQSFNQVCTVINGFAEQTDLEKYYDIYDINDFDMLDARRGFGEEEFDDLESLRTLKIHTARFFIMRKLFLCALLALDANGDTNDLLRWTTAVEALRTLNASTRSANDLVQEILSEQDSRWYRLLQPSSILANILYRSISRASDAEACSHAWKRALAGAASEAELPFQRNSGLTG